MGVDPFLPPANGWLFHNGRGEFVEDPSLTWTLPSTSPPCRLMVTLSGAAKEAHGDCEGEYKSTGLISMGKQVKLQLDKSSFWINQLSLKVFKLEGSSDFYLFVKPFNTNWAIWSSLKADKRFIRSGSVGQACPAHPRNKFNKRDNLSDWSFNKAKEDPGEDWEEGGVIVQCSVHEHCSPDSNLKEGN